MAGTEKRMIHADHTTSTGKRSNRPQPPPAAGPPFRRGFCSPAPFDERGIALVTALVITLAVIVLISGVLYVVTQSTVMSGAGKRYTTASEAADGSIEIMKTAIQSIARGEDIASLPIADSTPPCLADAILFSDNTPCSATLTLPSSDLFSRYSASVTVTRLYASPLTGSRIEFPKAYGGPATTAIYYRINAVVTGEGNAKAETSALYRHVF